MWIERLLAVFITIALFSCVSSAILRSSKHKTILNKRHNSAVSKRDESEDQGPKLFFKGRELEPVTKVSRRHNSLVLECEAGGSPGPTIHWLKDGERIEQGTYHDYHDDEAAYEDVIGQDGLPLLRLSTTRSKLFIECVDRDVQGIYTCVAETPYDRITQSTKVRISSPRKGSYESCMVKKSLEGERAKIYLWTATRVEFQGNKVQLFCRATGSPQPVISWFDAEGLPIESGDKYQVTDNGDLIIDNINWFDMGVYTCSGSNKHGEDTADTFLYPTFRGDAEEEMLPGL